MKTSFVIAAAALATAIGLSTAAAQNSGPYYNVNAMDYPLNEVILGKTRVVYTANLPEIGSLELKSLSGAVYTDGSGHVAGQVYARIFFGGPNNHLTDYGAYSIDVTGKNSDRNNSTNPRVKMNLRGNGYDFDGTSNHPNASLSLKFTSTNVLIDIPALAITNGGTVRTNSAFTFLSGKITGQIHPGKGSKINNGQQINVNTDATLVTAGSTWTIVDGTNVTENVRSGSMVLDYLTNIVAQVIQPRPSNNRVLMTANVGSFGDLFAMKGNATYDQAKWSGTLSGVAFAKGSTLQLNGGLGPLVVAYEPTTDTNFPSGIPRIVSQAITTMTIKSGKLYGQKLPKDLQGFSIPATPLAGP